MTTSKTWPHIERIEVGSTALDVIYSGRAEAVSLPWFWVRDHSEDASSYDAHTAQRTVDSFAIDRSVVATGATLSDDGVSVSWPDGTPDAFLSTTLLCSLVAPHPAESRQLWNDPGSIDLRKVSYDRLMTDDGLAEWLGEIRRLGFAMVSGAPTGIDDAERIMNRIGYVRRTVFGDMWTLSSEVKEHADSAYGNETLEPHTDGCYSNDGPGMQFFLCSERTGLGGESVLVDGFAAAEQLRSNDPAAFDVLAEVSVPGHYIEEGVNIRASRPTIRLDDAGELLQVSFNNYDRSPFILPEPQLSAWYDAYSALHDLFVDESSWFKYRLEPGDALIFDNWRCLHGRMAYTGKRVFHGGYLNKEDLDSRLRVSS